ncbi:MAG: cold shock domain-containing protein [Proteobacteria bacterium]|nr:cold shock domain-containing protein [Pseudomonadota bacterium]
MENRRRDGFRPEVSVPRVLRRGRVRWYDRELGYGFICPDASCEDVFVCRDAIQVPGSRFLRQGQRVFFEYIKTPRGVVAKHVVPILEKARVLARHCRKREQEMLAKE